MNASTLRTYIIDALRSVSDAGDSADSIIAGLRLRGIDLDTSSGNARTSALVAVALFPEHIRSTPDLTPVERLRVFEGLAQVAPDRASGYRAEFAPQIATAMAARERDRFLAAERKADTDQAAWRAQKRLDAVRESLRVEQLKIRRLEAQLEGPFQHTARPALMLSLEREAALNWEIAGLEKLIAEAGTVARAFATGGA